jgi:hypothetical protein
MISNSVAHSTVLIILIRRAQHAVRICPQHLCDADEFGDVEPTLAPTLILGDEGLWPPEFCVETGLGYTRFLAGADQSFESLIVKLGKKRAQGRAASAEPTIQKNRNSDYPKLGYFI